MCLLSAGCRVLSISGLHPFLCSAAPQLRAEGMTLLYQSVTSTRTNCAEFGHAVEC